MTYGASWMKCNRFFHQKREIYQPDECQIYRADAVNEGF